MLRIIFFYLASFGSSLLGNSITAIALPLLVLMTTGSPLGAGAVAIAAAVPSAIAGLLMGSVIDRINRRTAAILSDVISAVAVLILSRFSTHLVTFQELPHVNRCFLQ
jgi:MFS family permease